VYKGHFKNGKKHGRGKIFYRDGSTFEGEWRHGSRKAGPGALALASGDVFVGLFDAHGLYDGPQCVLTLANGDRYQGGFAKGAKHGTGKMKYSASGDFYEGQWRKGVKVKL
jgi:hypothetical protein